jgi:hypothetical protein
MQSPCILNADALSAIVANGGLALPVSYRENALTPPKISAASRWSRATSGYTAYDLTTLVRIGKATGTWQMQTAKARLAEVVDPWSMGAAQTGIQPARSSLSSSASARSGFPRAARVSKRTRAS